MLSPFHLVDRSGEREGRKSDNRTGPVRTMPEGERGAEREGRRGKNKVGRVGGFQVLTSLVGYSISRTLWTKKKY